ncbi:MAG: hypothetical protein Q9201_000668 [Fulgogasparrea decipioides]
MSVVLTLHSDPASSLAVPAPGPSTPPTNNDHLLLPNIPTNLTALNLTISHNTPATAYAPQCWPDLPPPKPILWPIDDPPDCYETIVRLVGDSDPDQPLIWMGRHHWIFDSCGLYLEPIPTRSLIIRDTFTKSEITRQALQIIIFCVTERSRYFGGKVKVGRGVYEVIIMNGFLPSSTRGNVGGTGRDVAGRENGTVS